MLYQYPDNKELLIQRAKLLMGKEQYPLALKLVRKILIIDSQDEFALKAEPLLEQISLLDGSFDPNFLFTIDKTIDDADQSWLEINAQERMDASNVFFNSLRRSFHIARYLFAVDYCHGKTVLDCASGTGYGSHILRYYGANNYVVGVEYSLEAVTYANKYHSPLGVHFMQHDACCISFPRAMFDVIVSFETIEHVASDHALLEVFVKSLDADGTLIISSPNDWHVDGVFHLRSYNITSFTCILEQYFNEITLYNQNSGSEIHYNHNCAPGITLTTPSNHHTAECFIAVCRKPVTS